MSKHILFKDGILAARYDSDIHGERMIEEQNHEYDPETSLEGPTILVDNPDCKIPPEAIQVSDALFRQTINENDGVWSLVNGEIVKLPFPPPSAEQVQSRTNAEARAYLLSTDWYVVRFAETGVEIPAEVAAARQAARDSVL
ncbi:MAG TPA: hypothetical protein VIO56_06810 [Methylotenera sp.]